MDISLSDIKIPAETVKDLAVKIGFTGIGLYGPSKGNFIHLDVRNNPHPRGYSFWIEE